MHKVDVFGRSAFNRYYYASFLIVREMLSELDKAWSGTPHKSIPELLTKGVLTRIRKITRMQEKQGLLNFREASIYKDSANIAANELSQLLDEAYNIRVISDYHPEEKAIKNGGQIRLKTSTLGAADNWPNRAERYSKSLLKVWKQLGIS